jgi:hypothetical protein
MLAYQGSSSFADDDRLSHPQSYRIPIMSFCWRMVLMPTKYVKSGIRAA